MSSTNKTTYYELPQFVDNDIFNPLVDDNDAYNKIDTALHNIANAEADDASDIVSIKSRLDSAEGDIDALEAQNGNNALTTTAQTLSGAVNELDADASALDGRLDIVEDDINNVSTGLKSRMSSAETELVSLDGRLDTVEDDINNVSTGLKPRMSSAETELVSLDGRLDIVEDDVSVLTNHKFLFVGDSYGVGESTWVTEFVSHLGISNSKFANISNSGAGFIDPSHSFISLITNYSGTIPRDEITDIIVCGGVNDADPANSPTASSLRTAIYNFVSYAKENYPNAKVYIGMIGGLSGVGLHPEFLSNINTVVLETYSKCARYGAIYLNGVENIMNDWLNNFNADGVHPNAVGTAQLGIYVAQSYLNGYASVMRQSNAYTVDDGITASFNADWLQYNDTVVANMGGLFTFDAEKSITSRSDVLVLLEEGCPYYKGVSNSANLNDCVPIAIQLFTTDGDNETSGDLINANLVFNQNGSIGISIPKYGVNITRITKLYVPLQSITLNLYKHR